MSERQLNIKIGVNSEESAKKVRAFAEELKKAEGAAGHLGTGTKKLTDGFSALQVGIAAVAGSAIVGKLISGMRDALQAAGEAEQAHVKLALALKNVGQAARLDDLEDFATSLMMATGQSDELTKQLLAQFTTLGANADQSMRLARAATDMGAVMGSVEGAAMLLARAMDGDVAALSRFGIEVTDAEKKSGDFEAVLRKVEAAFGGQAQAQLGTYAGQTKLLGEQFDELKETLGNKLLPTATSWLKWVNDAIAAHHRMTTAVDKLTDAELRQEMMRLQRLKGQAGTLGHFDTDVAEVDRKIAAVQEQLNAAAIQRKTDRFFAEPGASSTSAFKASPKGTATEAKKTADATKEAHGYMIDYRLETAAAARELERIRNLGGDYDFLGNDSPEAAARRQAARNADVAANSFNADLLFDQQADARYQAELEADRALEAERLASTYDLDAVLSDQLDDRYAQEQRANDELHRRKLQQQHELANQIVGAYSLVKSMLSGDIGGAISTAGMLTGNPLLAAGGMILGDIINANQGPRTEGGKARKELRGLLRGGGYDVDRPLARDNPFFQETGGVWQEWAEMLSGSDSIGQGGEILAASFDDLGLSMGETADRIGDLLEESEGLDQFTADMQAASSAFMTSTNLSREQIEELATLYGDAETMLKRRNELREQIQADLSAFGSATGQEREDILNRLDANQEELSKLMTPQEKTADATQTSAAHLGTLVSYFTGQEIPSASTPTNADTSTGRTDGQSTRSAGGRNITINVSGAVGDHRDIARKIHTEIRALERQRAV